MKQDITTLTAKEINGEKKEITLPKHTSLAELYTLIDAVYNKPMQISTTTGIAACQPTESCWHREKYLIEISDADDNPTITLTYNDDIQQKTYVLFAARAHLAQHQPMKRRL